MAKGWATSVASDCVATLQTSDALSLLALGSPPRTLSYSQAGTTSAVIRSLLCFRLVYKNRLPDVVVPTCNPALGRLRLEASSRPACTTYEFKASPNYIIRNCLYISRGSCLCPGLPYIWANMVIRIMLLKYSARSSQTKIQNLKKKTFMA